MKKLLSLAALAFGTVVATNSDAGIQPYTNDASCYSSNGGGYCFGNMLSFQTSSDPNAYAQFGFYPSVTGGSAGGYFGAELNGAYYSCNMPASFQAGWPSTITNQGYFYVGFNNGSCNTLELFNGSLYSHF